MQSTLTRPRKNSRKRAERSTSGRAERRLPKEERARSSADMAYWSCGCGRTFRAPVSTGVPCPRCGGVQAW